MFSCCFNAADLWAATRRANNDTICTYPHIPSCYDGPCLLNHLQPVRQCLHAFVRFKDAMQLMRASRSITASLLSGYAIIDSDYALRFRLRTSDDLKRSIAFFAQYGMRALAMSVPADWVEPLHDTRMLAMSLPPHWDRPLVDAESGMSVLPSSLVVLMLGLMPFRDSRPCMLTALSGDINTAEQQYEHWVEQHGISAEKRNLNGKDAELYRLIHPVDSGKRGTKCYFPWDVFQYGGLSGLFNQPILPVALPHGLRFLHIGPCFNHPLQVGGIPDTVEVLQFGFMFNQPLAIGHLPSSLTHLIFGHNFLHPLLPGVLPVGLKRLHLGENYKSPLLPDVLPPRLEKLSLGMRYNHPIPPGVIPSSVTHLRLSSHFNQPLHVGSIPEGVRHLSLGESFNYPLPPGVLPTSLRELAISQNFNQPLQHGSIPDALEVLAFASTAEFQQPLQPGVIPASVIAVSLSIDYTQELIAGGIPSTVKWLRLPVRYRRWRLRNVLNPSTRVVWDNVW